MTVVRMFGHGINSTLALQTAPGTPHRHAAALQVSCQVFCVLLSLFHSQCPGELASDALLGRRVQRDCIRGPRHGDRCCSTVWHTPRCHLVRLVEPCGQHQVGMRLRCAAQPCCKRATWMRQPVQLRQLACSVAGQGPDQDVPAQLLCMHTSLLPAPLAQAWRTAAQCQLSPAVLCLGQPQRLERLLLGPRHHRNVSAAHPGHDPPGQQRER